jgi:hypothetical protein
MWSRTRSQPTVRNRRAGGMAASKALRGMTREATVTLRPSVEGRASRSHPGSSVVGGFMIGRFPVAGAHGAPSPVAPDRNALARAAFMPRPPNRPAGPGAKCPPKWLATCWLAYATPACGQGSCAHACRPAKAPSIHIHEMRIRDCGRTGHSRTHRRRTS